MGVGRMSFNKHNLYLGNSKVVYRISDNVGICLRDSFGGALGKEIYLREMKPCCEGSEETLKDLEDLYNRYVRNRQYDSF